MKRQRQHAKELYQQWPVIFFAISSSKRKSFLVEGATGNPFPCPVLRLFLCHFPFSKLLLEGGATKAPFECPLLLLFLCSFSPSNLFWEGVAKKAPFERTLLLLFLYHFSLLRPQKSRQHVPQHSPLLALGLFQHSSPPVLDLFPTPEERQLYNWIYVSFSHGMYLFRQKIAICHGV